MRRSIQLVAFAIVLGGNLGSVQADGPMFHKTHVEIARNNSWPQPFRGQDAYSVVAPFEVMKRNGWRDNNTVGSILFVNNELTEAGRLKVTTLVASSPASQRMIYVQIGMTQAETATRVKSIQTVLADLIPEGEKPPIQITNIAPTTSPGAYQTLVHRAIQQSTPKPRLPAFTGSNQPAAVQESGVQESQGSGPSQ
jgi:hypothetical protein